MSQNVHLISQSQYRSLSHPSYTVSLLTYCITLRESLISVGAIFQNVTLGDFPGGAVFRTLLPLRSNTLQGLDKKKNSNKKQFFNKILD